ncbi:MAG TPA: M50 family metallopeptidase [Pirellulales bacterium]|nr:M50 family metallopeptidase [Pirellulales bacterium]
MVRPFACLFFTATLAASWLAMTATHEFGHVLHVWLSGGRVVGVELPPRGLGHTRVSLNPHPQFVAWGGACWGSILGTSAIVFTRRGALSRWCGRFFAGTCLIANGAYLGIGGLFGDPNGADDAHELLRQGAHAWQLQLFGLVAASAGLVVRHRLGRRLGFDLAIQIADRRTLAMVLALAGSCLVAGCLLPAE